jgi:hypothetical protein
MEMFRVAVSDVSSQCDCEEFKAGEHDYCARCQYAYVSHTEFRTDYGHSTVGWYETEEEAEKALAELRPSF